MHLSTVLFDLDGTLLPMEQERFIKAYIGGIVKALAPRGYDPLQIARGITEGTLAMIKNSGEQTNEAVFWRTLTSSVGDGILSEIGTLDAFYQTDFQRVSEACGYNPDASECVHRIRKMGLRVALATNPLFPKVATESRIRWAGLQPSDFEIYTTYEDYHFCKPRLEYYSELLERLGVRAEECLMVGNDVKEDMVAEQLGMRVFLLTDCLINTENRDIRSYPKGSFPELLEYIHTQTCCE